MSMGNTGIKNVRCAFLLKNCTYIYIYIYIYIVVGKKSYQSNKKTQSFVCDGTKNIKSRKSDKLTERFCPRSTEIKENIVYKNNKKENMGNI